ncbi:MAG: 3-carboxy-cis,cis-muconate cycloisomerase [Xanthobacteraceae bacterium]
MPASAIDSTIFRAMFASEPMRQVFSDGNRIQKYLDFEAALARAEARLGVIPPDAAEEIGRHCDLGQFDLVALAADTAAIGVPVPPVVNQLVRLCRDGLGEWCHFGATTQDVMDTATILQIREALALIEADMAAIAEGLAGLARAHRDTVMAGRSYLQQAIPTTFGHKIAGLLAAFIRHRQRLAEIKPRLLVGQFGGAVGTLASLGDRGLAVQAVLMQELGLGVPDIAWHSARDRIAEIGAFLGMLTATCAKLAFDVKLLMQTEVEEASEPSAPGRGSSSTMPQKRNPVASALIGAAAPLVRQHVGALLEAIVEDHERASGAWQIEWIAVPEIFCLSAGVLAHTRLLAQGLSVSPERMRANLDITRGLVTAEAVAMALADKLGRHHAHHLIADISRQVAATGRPLADLLAENSEVARCLDGAAIARLTDPANYVGAAGDMIDRVLTLYDTAT